MAELIARTRDSKPNIIGIPEVKPKLNRYKPALAECSLTEVGSDLYTRPTSTLSVWLSFIFTNRFSWKFVFMCISVASNLLSKYKMRINVSNDLTKTKRAREKELWEEAKKMKDKDDSGDYKYKVRGSGKKVFHGVNVKSFFSNIL
jgi:hypothetical protein